MKPDPKKYIIAELKLEESFEFSIEWKRPMFSRYLYRPKLEDVHEGENVHTFFNRNGISIIPHDISLLRGVSLLSS